MARSCWSYSIVSTSVTLGALTLPLSAMRETIAQLVRRVSGVEPGAIGNRVQEKYFSTAHR